MILLVAENGEVRLCVPNDARLRVHLLDELHDLPTSGHLLGYHKTYHNARRLLYWPRMDKFVKDYVACPICQRIKPSTQAPLGLLQPLPVSSRR